MDFSGPPCQLQSGTKEEVLECCTKEQTCKHPETQNTLVFLQVHFFVAEAHSLHFSNDLTTTMQREGAGVALG